MATASASPSCNDAICGVCFNKHTDTRLLECLHSFCRDCVDKLSVTKDNGAVRCPLCQHISALPENGATGLPEDFTATQEDTFSLAGLQSCTMCKDGQSSTIPSLWCKKCSVALCDEHAVSHIRTSVPSGHYVDAIESDILAESQGDHSSASHQTAFASSTPVCPKHDQPLRFYCAACDVTICGDCAIIGDHAQHNPVGYVVDFVEERKAEVAVKLDDLKQVTNDRVDPSLQAVDSVCIQLKQSAEEVSSAIQEAGKRAIEAVETCVAEMLQEVDDIMEGHLKLLDQHREQLNSHLKAVRNAIQFGQKLLCKRSDRFGEAFFPLIHALETRVVGLISANNLEQCRHHSQIRLRRADDATVTEKIKASLGKVLPCHASPLHSTVEGQLDVVTLINSEIQFTLQAKDENGRTLTEGGDVITTKWRQSSDNTSYSSVSVEDNDNGTYTICCGPASAGTYQLEVLVNGEVIPRQISITYAKSAWDAAKSNPSIYVTNEKQKASKLFNKPKGGLSVVGCHALRHGRPMWKVQIAQDEAYYMLGVVTKPLSDSREDDSKKAFGWCTCSWDVTYRGSVEHDKQNISWAGGDTFELCLDCDHHTLQIRNLRSGETSTLRNLPDEEYYQFARLSYRGNSVQFVD